MSKKMEISEKDPTTEEKIKEAARKVFHKKGYAGTRTRDIAEEAGVNLALLNYYFRSKEKLFDLIMEETMQLFFQSMKGLINNERTTLQEKLQDFTTQYIDFLCSQPELPIFILNEIQMNPKGLSERMGLQQVVIGAYILKQFKEDIGNKDIPDSALLQMIINIIGMMVFPFIGKSLLKEIFNLSDEQFQSMMNDRKKLVPLWIESMFSAPINPKDFSMIQNIKL
ncbi:MAG TPA: TetR/AcrR family transcriptional regulator [Bacteroidales bacterium]|nr:TetR/AcrR family transcriptional regulator [Bacteroidales bacterium]